MHTAGPFADNHYDLYLRAGNADFYFRNDNHGITLTAERMQWTWQGQDDSVPFANIRAIHLRTGGDFTDPVNACLITFADGEQLFVTNANERGTTSDERRPVYRAFVHDLHGRLAAIDPPAAEFTAGFKGIRYPLIIACAIMLGVICIGVPLAAMIVTGSLGPATVLFAGVGPYWPLAKAIGKNEPRNYDPRHPPEELLG